MTAHIVVRPLDSAPATLSHTLISELLRGELGFDGLVITDALDMAAVAETVGLEESGVRALAAGADALCLGPIPGADDVERLHRAILAAVATGRLAEARLAEAASRVAETAAWTHPAHADVDRSVVERGAQRAIASAGDVGLSAAPLVVDLASDASIAAGPAAYTLGDAVRRRWPDAAVTRFGPSLTVDDRPLVVVLRDAARDPEQQAAAQRLLRDQPTAVLVETGMPNWRPPEPHAWIATHGMARVSLDAAAALLAGSSASRAVLGARES
jgi:beta-N-acetylhexosaminidase